MAGRGRPPKNARIGDREGVGIIPESPEAKHRADTVWQTAEDVEYEKFNVIKDDKQIVKISKITRQYHIDQGNKKTSKVKRRLFGQYKKIKGGWHRYPGSPSIEALGKLGIKL